LVAAVGATPVVWADGPWSIAAPAALVFLFVIQVVLYGQIASDVAQEPSRRWPAILQSHWFNYLIFAAVTLVPTGLLLSLAKSSAQTTVQAVVFVEFARFAIQLATLYMLPLVFLMRIHIQAVPLGLMFLVRAWRYSVVPIGLLAGAGVISAIRFFLMAGASFDSVPLLLTIMIAGSVLTWYLSVLAYATATQILAMARGSDDLHAKPRTA
jgi:hypothetical protein